MEVKRTKGVLALPKLMREEIVDVYTRSSPPEDNGSNGQLTMASLNGHFNPGEDALGLAQFWVGRESWIVWTRPLIRSHEEQGRRTVKLRTRRADVDKNELVR